MSGSEMHLNAGVGRATSATGVPHEMESIQVHFATAHAPYIRSNTTCLLAGIPWAYTIHGRLTKIEASLQHDARRGERLDSLAERLMRLEMKADRAEEV